MTDLPNLPPLEPPAPDDQWESAKVTKGVRIPIPAAALVVIAVGLLGLWGGAQLKGSNASATTNATNGNGFRRGNGEFPGGGGGGRNGANPGRGGTVGTVQSVDGNMITITTPNGGTVTVTVNGSTTVTKTDTGSLSDVTPGENIIVRGTTNSDGSTTANQITVGNGALGFGFGRGGGANGGPGGPPASQPN
jgi:hypothetical protein